MLLLFETAAGLALFKIIDESKLNDPDSLFEAVSSVDGIKKLIHLSGFQKFKGMEQALKVSKRLIEGKMSKKLKKLVKKCEDVGSHSLAVADQKIGSTIHEALNIKCVTSPAILELMKAIRENISNLIPELQPNVLKNMSLGLSHSFSRFKLKYNPEKIDTMIIQGINLLDDIDKEINNYVMRCREWYGWHFPELGKVITDNITYVKVAKMIGFKTDAEEVDITSVVDASVQERVRAAANVSMGTEITDIDLLKITNLCDQILEMSEYRSNLIDYISGRMRLVAPNLSILVGELVGARLIAHAGSLLNLSKQPSSTVQVLGAEKALFNALKARRNTPKYGLIYHAQLISQASLKLKGKMSRSLAAKCALAIRCDALCEENALTQHTMKTRSILEQKLKVMEQTLKGEISGTGKAKNFQQRFKQYTNVSEIITYNTDKDVALAPQKRKFADDNDEDEAEQSTNIQEEVNTSKSKKFQKKL